MYVALLTEAIESLGNLSLETFTPYAACKYSHKATSGCYCMLKMTTH